MKTISYNERKHIVAGTVAGTVGIFIATQVGGTLIKDFYECHKGEIRSYAASVKTWAQDKMNDCYHFFEPKKEEKRNV